MQNPSKSNWITKAEYPELQLSISVSDKGDFLLKQMTEQGEKNQTALSKREFEDVRKAMPQLCFIADSPDYATILAQHEQAVKDAYVQGYLASRVTREQINTQKHVQAAIEALRKQGLVSEDGKIDISALQNYRLA